MTKHASAMISKRKIDVTWLDHTVRSPDMVEQDQWDPDLEHRMARIDAYGNRCLRVVVNIRKRPPHIVTAFFDRRRTLS